MRTFLRLQIIFICCCFFFFQCYCCCDFRCASFFAFYRSLDCSLLLPFPNEIIEITLITVSRWERAYTVGATTTLGPVSQSMVCANQTSSISGLNVTDREVGKYNGIGVKCSHSLAVPTPTKNGRTGTFILCHEA